MELDNIYFGDCINLMRDIPDKSIDLCVTDAPYLHINRHLVLRMMGVNGIRKVPLENRSFINMVVI